MSEAKKSAGEKKPEKKIKPAKDAWCMYIGPAIRGVIRQSQIFPMSAADVRKNMGEKLPTNAAPLIVDGKDLPSARQEVRTPGTALHYFYESLKRR